jgi:hypothetical protein
MAVTLAEVSDLGGMGYRDVKVVSITGPASYTTNGEVITPSDVGMASFDVLAIEQPSSTSEYSLHYDRTNGKIVYASNAETDAYDEVSNTTDLSSIVAYAIAVGPRG